MAKYKIAVTVLNGKTQETVTLQANTRMGLNIAAMSKVGNRVFLRAETKNLKTGKVVDVTTAEDIHNTMLDTAAEMGFDKNMVQEMIGRWHDEAMLQLASATDQGLLYVAYKNIASYNKTKNVSSAMAVHASYEELKRREVYDETIEEFMINNSTKSLLNREICKLL